MCMVDGADEPWKVFRREERRAAKSWLCGECAREISKGERYQGATGLMDGGWDTFRICTHCWVACEWLSRECRGWVYSMVREDIEEHIQEYQRFDLARLAVGMRRKWQRFSGGLMPVPSMPAVTP